MLFVVNLFNKVIEKEGDIRILKDENDKFKIDREKMGNEVN